MQTYRLLALAVAGRRIGFVFFVGDQLTEWQVSRRLSGSRKDRRETIQKWVEDFAPNAVVTERLSEESRKGGQAQISLDAIRTIAEDSQILHVAVPRTQRHANRYVEATELAKRYSELEPWLPVQPQFFERDPSQLLLFEALALAIGVLDDPTPTLAQALG